MTEKTEKKHRQNLPSYSSMAQCSSASGVPMAVLREAKRAGCPAFKYSRVDLGEFLTWFFAHETDDNENWLDRGKRADALLKEHKLEVAKKSVVEKESVEFGINKAVSLMFASLDRLSDEMPAIIQGMDAVGIKGRMTQSFAGLKERLREAFGEL